MLFALSVKVVFLLEGASRDLFTGHFMSLISVLLSVTFLDFLKGSLGMLRSGPTGGINSCLSYFSLGVLGGVGMNSMPVKVPGSLGSFLVFLRSSSKVALSSCVEKIGV